MSINKAPLRAFSIGKNVIIAPQGRTVTDIDEVNVEVPELTTELMSRLKAAKRRELMKVEEAGANKVTDGIRSQLKRKNEIMTSLDARQGLTESFHVIYIAFQLIPSGTDEYNNMVNKMEAVASRE